MEHSTSVSAPAPRRRRIGLVSLAIVGAAIAAFALHRPLVETVPQRSLVEIVPTAGMQTTLGEDDGVIPEGAEVTVFDEELPTVANLDPDLLDALRRATKDAEADGVELRIVSGWRSASYQERLLQEAVVKHGSEEEAARWAATAETSAHVSGEAVDIGPYAALDWLTQRGAEYGLCQIYGNEPWHYELRPEAVDDGCPWMFADPTEDPRMRS